MCPRRVRGAIQRQRARGASLRAPKPKGQRPRSDRISSSQGKRRRVTASKRDDVQERGLLMEFPASCTTASIPLNPLYWKGLPACQQAKLHSRYMLRSINVRFVPQVCTLTTGSVSFGVLWSETVFADETDIDSHLVRNGGTLTQVYKSATVCIRPSPKEYQIRGELNRTNNPGFLVFHRSSDSPHWCGRFYISYSVAFTAATTESTESYVYMGRFGSYIPYTRNITLMCLQSQRMCDLKPGTILQANKEIDGSMKIESEGSEVTVDPGTQIAAFATGPPAEVTADALNDTVIYTGTADLVNVVFSPLRGVSELNGYARFTVPANGLVLVQSINKDTGEVRVASAVNPYPVTVQYDYRPSSVCSAGYAGFTVEELQIMDDDGLFDWIKVGFRWITGVATKVMSAAAGVASQVGQVARTISNASDYVARKADQFHEWATTQLSEGPEDEFVLVTGTPGLLTVTSVKTAAGYWFPVTVTEADNPFEGSNSMCFDYTGKAVGNKATFNNCPRLALTDNGVHRHGLCVVCEAPNSDQIVFGFCNESDDSSYNVPLQFSLSSGEGVKAYRIQGYGNDIPTMVRYTLNNADGITYTYEVPCSPSIAYDSGVPYPAAHGPHMVASNSHHKGTLRRMALTNGEVDEVIKALVGTTVTMSSTPFDFN